MLYLPALGRSADVLTCADDGVVRLLERHRLDASASSRLARAGSVYRGVRLRGRHFSSMPAVSFFVMRTFGNFFSFTFPMTYFSSADRNSRGLTRRRFWSRPCFTPRKCASTGALDRQTGASESATAVASASMAKRSMFPCSAADHRGYRWMTSCTCASHAHESADVKRSVRNQCQYFVLLCSWTTKNAIHKLSTSRPVYTQDELHIADNVNSDPVFYPCN